MLQKEKLGKMSSKRELPRRKARRGKRSQSCFELQGNQQYLHASLSTASLPATLAPTRPSSRISQYRDPLSSFKPLEPTSDGSYKHTKSSLLRASSAPVARAQPDYRYLARRRKESILAEKTLTAEKTLKTELPEGETLHSFLVGGRYNSAHHVDVRSIQRLGVYVPRNNSVKSFINSAGTIPPSPEVYGLHPLRKHSPLIVDSTSTHSTERGLEIVRQDLEMQFNEESTASRHSLRSKHSTTLVSEELNGKEAKEAISPPNADHDQEDTDLTHNQPPIGDSGPVADEDTASSVVSASNLLSPEAQQLTQEILLETVSVGEDGNTTSVLEKTKYLSRSSVGLSAVTNTQSRLMLRSRSATSLRHTSMQKSINRPKSAYQLSSVEPSNPHNNSAAIFVDLSKLNSTEDKN
ncbi:hypothetical protein GBAR_LOCUS755 [Geodia barretti]|uniref:Uncharacterized protein n=1 Tax=Geodia barretti TaxID=519541 RepID=A0AA35QU48_GEOBA|nr:hypothetical protein GBAR_LOCUS755 [Geodia barretti]